MWNLRAYVTIKDLYQQYDWHWRHTVPIMKYPQQSWLKTLDQFCLLCKPLESDTLYLRCLTFCLQDCCLGQLSLLFLQLYFDVNFTCFSVWESWGRQKFRTYFSNLHKNNFYLKTPESLHIIFSSNIWIIKSCWQCFFYVKKDDAWV